MNTLSYIHGESQYLSALRACALVGEDVAEQAGQRFLSALRPGARQRIRTGWQVPEVNELLRVSSAAGHVATGPSPDPAARAAIVDLDRDWPQIAPSVGAGLEQLLDGWGLVARDADGLALNATLLAALCVAHNIAGECTWLVAKLPGLRIDVLRLSAHSCALEVAASASAAERAAWLRTAPEGASPALLRAVARAYLEDATGGDAASGQDAAAAVLRGALFEAVLGARAIDASLSNWLVDVPDAPISLQSTRPLLLVSGSEALLRAALGAFGDDTPVRATFVALLSGALAGDRVVESALSALGAGDVFALATFSAASAPRTPLEVIAGLASSSHAAAATVLVDEPAGGSITWRCLLAAAALPQLAEELWALLESGEDWGDFDAPGEGTLPRYWADVLVLAGVYDAGWVTRLGRFVEALDLPAADAEPGDVVGRYCSELAGAEQRLDPDRSPMSAYSHGLHDGVSEAYGDVWSPGDPFSARRRGDDTTK